MFFKKLTARDFMKPSRPQTSGKWKRCGTCGVRGIGKTKYGFHRTDSNQPWEFFCDKHRDDALASI